MSYTLWLAWRNISNHWVQSLVSILVVALAVGLSVAVFALAEAVRVGILQASDPFGVLVVGPKGSAQQLVLNTLLLQDVPLGNIPLEIHATLRTDPGVHLAIPVAMGDNIGGAPIIGTDLSFFELRASRTVPPSFQVAQGRLFELPEAHEHESDHTEERAEHAEEASKHVDEHAAHEHQDAAEVFEAVLGSRAAEEINLKINDRFQGAHGLSAHVLESDVHHDTMYEVVGILHPSNTPYDTAVFVPIEAVWYAHHENSNGNELIEADQAASPDSVTAILVQPVNYVDAYRLWQEFYVSTEAQAAFPGEELGGLFDLLNQAVRVLNGVGYLVLGVAALTVFLSIYSATLAREQAMAIMRSVGSSRRNIFLMVLFESLLLTGLGSLLGRLLGYGAAWGMARLIVERSAVPVQIRFMTELEPTLWLLTLLVAVLAGLVPAFMAYRVNVVEKLFPA
jgi:putative ABC transport system permease protein